MIDSQYLLVIKESGRVLLFSLWKISDSKVSKFAIVVISSLKIACNFIATFSGDFFERRL